MDDVTRQLVGVFSTLASGIAAAVAVVAQDVVDEGVGYPTVTAGGIIAAAVGAAAWFWRREERLRAASTRRRRRADRNARQREAALVDALNDAGVRLPDQYIALLREADPDDDTGDVG